MQKALDKVIAIRMAAEDERKLRALARADDRSLASWLRRQLRAMVVAEGSKHDAVSRPLR
jgi:predicted DNA-binding protein